MRVTIVIFICFIVGFECKGLNQEFTWTKITYAWPKDTRVRRDYGESSGSIHFPDSSEDTEDSFQNSFRGSYIYENNIPIGANRWKDKLFVTVPRRRPGIPSTLNFVWINSTERHNVPLIPYPNWHINQLEPTRLPEGLVSVYRIAVDACDRLWLVDTGLIETPGNNTRIQPARLIIINLQTDKVVRKYTFKPTDVNPRTTLSNLAVDVTAHTCNNAFAYVTDLTGYGLVIYDFQENDSWRVAHNYFYPESLNGDLNIGGQKFQWPDGIFSIALSDIDITGYRTAYFHSMAGIHLFSVSTRVLRNRDLSSRVYHGNDFKNVLNKGEGFQTSGSGLHIPSGILFMSFVNKNAVGCLNVKNLENIDIVHKDDRNLIYPSDLKIYEDEVIVISNKMPIFVYSQLNYNEVNFIVWISKVKDAAYGTSCLSSKGHGYH